MCTNIIIEIWTLKLFQGFTWLAGILDFWFLQFQPDFLTSIIIHVMMNTSSARIDHQVKINVEEDQCSFRVLNFASGMQVMTETSCYTLSLVYLRYTLSLVYLWYKKVYSELGVLPV